MTESATLIILTEKHEFELFVLLIDVCAYDSRTKDVFSDAESPSITFTLTLRCIFFQVNAKLTLHVFIQCWKRWDIMNANHFVALRSRINISDKKHTSHVLFVVFNLFLLIAWRAIGTGEIDRGCERKSKWRNGQPWINLMHFKSIGTSEIISSRDKQGVLHHFVVATNRFLLTP